MKSLLVLITVFIVSAIHHQVEMAEKNNRKMIWNDEFDYSGNPDSEKWAFELGNGCPEICGWGNNELQYYTDHPDNIRVNNSNLIIEAHKNDSANYTSAKLVSSQKSSWLYGRIEVSARLPKGKGTWPAIWMLPKDWEYGGWPKSGEIDIMEHVGFDHGKVHGTVHTESFNHLLGTEKGKSIDLADVHETFHTYIIEWDQKGIAFLVDNIRYNYFENTSVGYQEWPFDQPFYLVLNLAVGGNWGGKEGIDDAIWPQRMEIDFVRVYQY